MTENMEIQIDKMVYGGDGIGHLPDGRAIFVPQTLPGEMVLVSVTEEKKRYLRGSVTKILSASEKRIQPRCKHFGICGGCHYQMLEYPDQLAAKEAIVCDQFARIANIDLGDRLDVRAGIVPWNYRQTVQFHITNDGHIGYQQGNTNHIIPIEECFLPKAEYDEILKMLDFTGDTQVQKVQMRWGDDDVMIVLEGETAETPDVEIDFPGSILFKFGDDVIVLAGDEYQVISVLEQPFVVSGTSFFQASAEMAGEMVTLLMKELHPSEKDLVLDCYCGIGLFSWFLAQSGAVCVGIESSSSAVADFAANMDTLESTIEIYEGLVENILPSLNLQPTICVVDPPRSGLAPTVVDCLINLQVPRLAYVSCDVATLARDIKRLLAGGYQLQKVTLFDQFPQTYHMETISILSWKGDDRH